MQGRLLIMLILGVLFLTWNKVEAMTLKAYKKKLRTKINENKY